MARFIFDLVIFLWCSCCGCKLATDHGNRTPDLIRVAKFVYIQCSRFTSNGPSVTHVQVVSDLILKLQPLLLYSNQSQLGIAELCVIGKNINVPTFRQTGV